MAQKLKRAPSREREGFRLEGRSPTLIQEKRVRGGGKNVVLLSRRGKGVRDTRSKIPRVGPTFK